MPHFIKGERGGIFPHLDSWATSPPRRPRESSEIHASGSIALSFQSNQTILFLTAPFLCGKKNYEKNL
jgi:hypothetical protein